MRPFRAFVLASGVSLIVAAACARPIESRVVADDRPEGARGDDPSTAPTCAIAGEMSLGWDVALSARRDGDASFASFADRPVHLETLDVTSIGGARVRLRAETKFGLSFEGWVESDRLDVEAARVVELAGRTVYLPRGARVALVAGVGRSVVVSPMTRHLQNMTAIVDCDSLAIGAVPAGDDGPFAAATNSPEGGVAKVLGLKGSTLAVSAVPDGDPVFTLHAGGDLRLPVVETKHGVHVHYEDGVVVDGWVRRDDLLVPTARHAIGIGCGMGISVTSAVPPSASLGVARKATSVFVGETTSGPARGSIAAGGSVIVLGVSGAFAEITPRCGEISPSSKTHFYVESSALEIGPAAPFATLRAACR